MFQHTHTHELESHDERRIGNRNPGESMWKKPSDEGFILADIPGVEACRRRFRAAVAPFAERLAAGAKAGSTPAGDRGKGGENR